MLFTHVCAGFFRFLVRKLLVFGLSGFSLVPCASWCTSFASFPACVYRAWVSEMCLLLGSQLDSTKYCLSKL